MKGWQIRDGQKQLFADAIQARRDYESACNKWRAFMEDNWREDYDHEGADVHLLEFFLRQVEDRWGTDWLGMELEALLEKAVETAGEKSTGFRLTNDDSVVELSVGLTYN